MAITVDELIRENGTGAVLRTDHYAVEKDLSGWKLVEPVDFPVDNARIRQIFDNMKKVEQSRLIVGAEYKELDRKAAGLVEPDITAVFGMPGTSITLRIGAETPVGWENYMEVAGRDAAYCVPRQFKETLTLKADGSDKDFRRRQVFDAQAYEISGLFLESPQATIEIQRADDLVWQMIEPVRDAADNSKVKEMLEKAVALQVRSFTEAPADFGRPRLTITLVRGTVSQRLQVGDVVVRTNEYDEVERFCYARRSEYQQYITLKPEELTLFEGAPAEYRAKELVIRNEFQDPEHLTQEVEGLRTDFSMAQNAWFIPELSTPLEDEILVEDYVYRWLDYTIADFAEAERARTALEKPWITLTVKYKQLDQPQTLVLSAPSEGKVYVERTPGIFVTLDEQDVRDLLITNEISFLNKNVIDVPYDTVTGLALRKGASGYTCMKGTNQWIGMTGNTVRDMALNLTDELEGLLPIEAKGYIATVTEEQYGAYGLDAPRYTFQFTAGDKQTSELELGAEVPGGGVYALLSGQPYLFVLSQDTANSLIRLFTLVETRITASVTE